MLKTQWVKLVLISLTLVLLVLTGVCAGGNELAFLSHPLLSGATGGGYVCTADLDSDGDTDILSTITGQIAWMDNTGGTPPRFTARTLAASDGQWPLAASDLNGDGRIDIAAAGSTGPALLWYENAGGSPPAFVPHTIATSQTLGSLVVRDLNGDGSKDLIACGKTTLFWYENGGGASPAFTSHAITASLSVANSMDAADVDADGDCDIVCGSAGDRMIRWYESSSGSSPSFVEHIISTGQDATRIVAVDMDRDADMDLVAAGAGRPLWYENSGSLPTSFTAHTILTPLFHLTDAYFACPADINNDGWPDLVLSGSHMGIAPALSWYQSDAVLPLAFHERVIPTDIDHAVNPSPVDLDGDGDIDIVCGDLTWYENRLVAPARASGHWGLYR